MCGIFGHSKPDKRLSRSRQALDTLTHRGPDQWGEFADAKVYLGHRRLSIIDLSEHGRQPMTDGQIYIIVNGEIYNYQTLKKELQPKYKFISASDSEVLIHGYHEWGIDKLLTKLEGMYAFALYDQPNAKLFLVRDRPGIKPLYWGEIDGQLAWGSELKALSEFFGEAKLTVDKTAVYDYLTYRYIPTPKSLYQNISKLPPAHYLEYDLATRKSQLKQYWQLPVDQRSISLEAAAEKLRALVDEAVQEQLMSDVPVGFFLSGGLDSSTVVAAATKFSRKLNTYSIGFDVKEHSETHFAELVAKHFKTNHLSKDLSVSEVKKSFANLRQWYDEPNADTSAFPVYLVSSLARPSSTVVLTGDGGDEIFGGYNWYKQFADGIEDYIKQNSRGLKRFSRSARRDLEFAYYTQLMAGMSAEQKAPYRQLLGIDKNYDDYWYFRKFYQPELPLYTRLQFTDFHTYLPDDILTKVDRASMAVSLECRVPLLSTKLIEFMFSLPENLRYHNDELKGLMKYAYHEILPGVIIERDKKGFSIPTGRWQADLIGDQTSMVEYILQKLYPELLA